ncbi:c-type cytochrome [Candidatus Foliamicus sp.]
MHSKYARLITGVLCLVVLGWVTTLTRPLDAQDASFAAADAEPADPRLVTRGKRLYVFCQACHATEAVSGSKIGPNLAGIFNRPAASLEDSVYSDALKAQEFVWDEEKLDAWLERPANLVPGNTMSFVGLPSAQNRAALIAYLKTL